ncbi:MAG: hypothetical protein MHM6MM_008665 [Cercozoa sp. M6MM]
MSVQNALGMLCLCRHIVWLFRAGLENRVCFVSPDQQKAVVLQLRTLASDPENQEYIVREMGCMSGLVNFLGSDHDEIALPAMQAIHFLASHPGNRDSLANFEGLLDKLQRLTQHSNENVVHFARQTIEKLDLSASTTASSKATQSFTRKSLITLQFRVSNLSTPIQRQVAERVVLQVRGVVSVTVDLLSKKLTVYTTRDTPSHTDEVVRALDDASLQAVPFDEVAGASASASASTPAPVSDNVAPAYLDAAGAGQDSGQVGPGALTQYHQSAESCTLASRLKKQRQKKAEQAKKQEEAKSWGSTVKSWFW